ncbi:MAG: hypothetical protein BWY78_01168 [Alphaproteobacteria bacterium ADurb.Bin438]|nr:MAG: hypothetical protein BWY78_01168 [Alphaproteobacteria bacterium ADurb.Bin438]
MENDELRMKTLNNFNKAWQEFWTSIMFLISTSKTETDKEILKTYKKCVEAVVMSIKKNLETEYLNLHKMEKSNEKKAVNE